MESNYNNNSKKNNDPTNQCKSKISYFKSIFIL